MYSVVGCTDCSALWVVSDRPDTTECPRCGKRRQFDKLRQFVETDDEDHAREVRASMLAARAGEGDAFADLPSYAEMEADLDDVGLSEGEYLEGSGIDAEAVSEAGERAAEGRGGSTSREETVRAALRDLDAPTEADVVAYCEERGVSADDAAETLSKLRRAGDVIERGGTLRVL